MPFTTTPDGSIEIESPRTPGRAFFAVVALLPAAAWLLAYGGFAIYSRIWTAPPRFILLLLVFGVLLNPVTWASLIGVLLVPRYWRGRTLVYLNDGFFVLKPLDPLGFCYRTDLRRFATLSVSVKRYPRDDLDPQWRTSFRPRVVIQNGGSPVIGLGAGFSIEEASGLARTVSELVGVPAVGHVEQRHQPDGQKVEST